VRGVPEVTKMNVVNHSPAEFASIHHANIWHNAQPCQ
jgi:hypothetical protein